jgi:predicted nucleotidyltransferase
MVCALAFSLAFVTPRVTWEQALAWRMRRHFLDPVNGRSVAEVVRRLCGVQSQVSSYAELCIRVRRTTSRTGDVARALGDGRVIKTWAMRGTLHLLTPEDAGAFLALIADGRRWERPSWLTYFRVTRKQLELFRQTARAALDGGELTREELIAEIVRAPGLGHVGDALREGWGTLLKPLAWQGDLCFGPSRGNRVTFRRPDRASSRWAGLPDVDEAGRRAVTAYLRAYGPATPEAFSRFIGRGLFPKRRLEALFRALGKKVGEITVGVEPSYILADDLDELVATKPTNTVRLVPGFDQFVLGPGTDDGHVIASHRRTTVSRQSGWIAPVVLVGGVVRGTWEVESDRLVVEWFKEARTVPRKALVAEAQRLADLLGRDLDLEVRRA